MNQGYVDDVEDLSGLDVDSYDPYMAEVPAAAPAPAPRPAAPVVNTTVFAAGQGNAAPMPNQGLVRAHLINTATNRPIDLATNRLIMGRSSTSDIVLDDINASRSHAEIRFEPQGVWSITDLGSTNGTLVNGQPITSHLLSEGDRISIGMTDFVFTQR